MPCYARRIYEKKLYIGLGVLILITISFTVVMRLLDQIGGERITQYQENNIQKITVSPLNSFSGRELKLDTRQDIEEFIKFINSMEYKELKKAGIIGGETAEYRIHIIYKSGQFENIDIRHAMPRGIVSRILGDSYIQIRHENNLYRCVSLSYNEFEMYINNFKRD